MQSTQQLTDQDFSPPSDSPTIETNEMIATITPFIKTKKAFRDLPGKFPITSSRGAQYFLVIYHYDNNAIFVHTLKNRTAQEIETAYLHIYNCRTSGMVG